LGVAPASSLSDLILRVSGFNIAKDFESFETRLAFQKTIYLLQASRAIPVKYPFNYYARGPYSPDWAREGFAVAGGATVLVDVTGDTSQVARMAQSHPMDAEWLEALATLHWYLAVDGRTKPQARQRALEMGKKCLTDRFDEAYEKLVATFGPTLTAGTVASA
jgi:hypothetical protein